MSGGESPANKAASLAEWLEWLEQLSPVEINLGLERVTTVLERLQLGRPSLVLHVAGTNGKGSTVEMLRCLFMAAGSTVGAYTSPHLIRYNERIRINNDYASDADIVAAFERVEACRGDLPLTYFEFATLAGAVVLDAANVAVAIFEIGLGGRLDAVNAIEPDGGIITNISLDHMDWLGHDLESIAAEKAGIMRKGKPFVFGARQSLAAIDRCASQCGAFLLKAGDDFNYSVEADGNWQWSGRSMRLEHLPKPVLGGAFQLQNAAAVLALLEALGREDMLRDDLIAAAFLALQLPGRFQCINKGCEWRVDVAHNEGGAQVLAQALRDYKVEGKTIGVIGVLGDKDVPAIIQPLIAEVDEWIAVTPDGPRALAAKKLAVQIAALGDCPVFVADSIARGLGEAARRATAADRVLVCGSFHTVGPALAWLEIYSPGKQTCERQGA